MPVSGSSPPTSICVHVTGMPVTNADFGIEVSSAVGERIVQAGQLWEGKEQHDRLLANEAAEIASIEPLSRVEANSSSVKQLRQQPNGPVRERVSQVSRVMRRPKPCEAEQELAFNV